MAYTTTFKSTHYVQTYRENGLIVGLPTYFLRQVSGSRSGTRVIGWRTKLKQHISAASAYSVDRTMMNLKRPFHFTGIFEQRAPLVGKTVIKADSFDSGYPLTGVLAHLQTSLVETEAKALTKAYTGIRQAQQHMSGPTFIAELRDTIRMFRSPFKSLVNRTHLHLDSLASAKRGIRGRSRAQAKSAWSKIISESYLEWAFGIDPLINDTREIAEAIARWETERDLTPTQRVRARSSKVDATTQWDRFYLSPINSTPQGSQRRVTTERSVQYVIGLKGDIGVAYNSNSRLLDLLGFNLADWVPAIYNVIPWTWLLDYFTNVGDIVEAAVTNTSNVNWIVKTTRLRSEETFNIPVKRDGIVAGFAASKYYCVQLNGVFNAEASVVRTTLVRTVPLTLSIPPLVLTHPCGSWRKMANMAAVLMARRNPDVR